MMGDNRDDSLDSRFSAGRGRHRHGPGRESRRPRAGHLLVDRRQRLLRQALDLVHRASRRAASATATAAIRNERDLAAVRRATSSATSRSDLALFERALTHSSLGRDSYERLEFLGDRVLGLVIGRWLYERFPSEPEGKLSRRYNALVARETCAEVGRELGLPAADPARQAGARRRRQQQRQCRRRRGRGADRRAAARRRARRRRRVHPPRLGAAPRRPGPRAASIPSRRSRSSPPRAACKPPAYEIVARTGAHHAPRFTVRVAVGNARRSDRRRLEQAGSRNRRRRRRCWSSCNEPALRASSR